MVSHFKSVIGKRLDGFLDHQVSVDADSVTHADAAGRLNVFFRVFAVYRGVDDALQDRLRGTMHQSAFFDDNRPGRSASWALDPVRVSVTGDGHTTTLVYEARAHRLWGE